MENKKNNGVVFFVLVILVVILSVLCVLFATETISFKSKDADNGEYNVNVGENNTNNETLTENEEKDILNSNIVVTKNGKVVSNEIPNELIGKYINKNSNDSYIQLTNSSIEVSEPTGGGGVNVFKDNQIKLYINYLNSDDSLEQYITVEFYIEDNGYNRKEKYTYVGIKLSYENEYQFKTISPTPAGGEGNNDYPYIK